jgi:hypothetical protein
MAVGVIPPRFTLERTPALLQPGLLTANVNMTHPAPGQSVRNDDSWNGLNSRILRNLENSAYMRHPNPPLTTGLTPDLAARADFFVWQEMLIGQTLPSPAVQVQTWAFGFHYAHSKAIRCVQDKVIAHRFNISGANGLHGAHGQHGQNGEHGENGRDGSYGGGDGWNGTHAGHGTPGCIYGFDHHIRVGCGSFSICRLHKHVLLFKSFVSKGCDHYQVVTVLLDHLDRTQEMQFWSSWGHPGLFTAKLT